MSQKNSKSTKLAKRVLFSFGSGHRNSHGSGRGWGWYFQWGSGLFGPMESFKKADSAYQAGLRKAEEIFATFADIPRTRKVVI